jgi:hypothetical protein
MVNVFKWSAKQRSPTNKALEYFNIIYSFIIYLVIEPPQYNCNIVESGVKHHKTKPSSD